MCVCEKKERKERRYVEIKLLILIEQFKTQNNRRRDHKNVCVSSLLPGLGQSERDCRPIGAQAPRALRSDYHSGHKEA